MDLLCTQRLLLSQFNLTKKRKKKIGTIYFSGRKALTAQLLFLEGCYYFPIGGLKVGFDSQ